jgi:hypothetical protein
MVHTTVAIVLLLLGAVFTGAPPAQGGAPMTPGQNNRNPRGVLGYRSSGDVLVTDTTSYDASQYPSYFNPAINVGPHPTSVPAYTPTHFVAEDNNRAISCQIDCESIITLPTGPNKIFKSCYNRYYSYGTHGPCKTPLTASTNDIMLAIELCGKSPCGENILDNTQILNPTFYRTIVGVNALASGVVTSNIEVGQIN